MNCRKAQEELYEHLGQQKLPDYLEEHITQCDDCRALWQELCQFGSMLGSDESFYIDPVEIDEMTQQIEQRIDNATPQNVPLFNRIIQFALPVAASLLFLFGISRLTNNPLTSYSDQEPTLYQISEWSDLTYGNDDDIEFDAITFNLLLRDYTSGVETASGEALLDDLTDDEFEYLKDNLDMGDLL
ncbi:MAG: hypothetical protein DRP47_03365 [Candidatus Zixiibacteriota bacterium]|nr:MAG: hypothetical protein DRP47_03365 [candidate division Zixibacteria bacterium]